MKLTLCWSSLPKHCVEGVVFVVVIFVYLLLWKNFFLLVTTFKTLIFISHNLFISKKCWIVIKICCNDPKYCGRNSNMSYSFFIFSNYILSKTHCLKPHTTLHVICARELKPWSRVAAKNSREFSKYKVEKGSWGSY